MESTRQEYLQKHSRAARTFTPTRFNNANVKASFVHGPPLGIVQVGMMSRFERQNPWFVKLKLSDVWESRENDEGALVGMPDIICVLW